MNDVTHVAALDAAFADQGQQAVPVPARSRLWGAICGVAFITSRSCIYLIALPVAALVVITGLVLHAAQSVVRHA
jgi:hypothetical protein